MTEMIAIPSYLIGIFAVFGYFTGSTIESFLINPYNDIIERFKIAALSNFKHQIESNKEYVTAIVPIVKNGEERDIDINNIIFTGIKET